MSTDTQRAAMQAALYPARDVIAQGEHYLRHVDAMTREGLHAKSRIAAELAARDIEIERLRACLKKTNDQAEHFEREWYLRGDEIERLRHNAQVLTNALWKSCGDDKEVVNATIESQGELK